MRSWLLVLLSGSQLLTMAQPRTGTFLQRLIADHASPALQQILQSVLFPQSVPPSQRFYLQPEDYGFLYHYMSEFPSESKYPKYDTAEYFNSYTKFLCSRPAGRKFRLI